MKNSNIINLDIRTCNEATMMKIVNDKNNF